jgi:hypothetical protein
MTTERILPAVALPAPARRVPVARTRVEAPAHAATRRREALLTTPARAGMLLGASAAVYAVTLTGISALQSSDDAAVIAHRQPYLDAVTERRAANDALESALVRADSEVQALGGFYARAGENVAAYEARLDALAALVAEVQGSAASLPTRISLPKVTVSSSVGTRAPATTARTGASGVP